MNIEKEGPFFALLIVIAIIFGVVFASSIGDKRSCEQRCVAKTISTKAEAKSIWLYSEEIFDTKEACVDYCKDNR